MTNLTYSDARLRKDLENEHINSLRKQRQGQNSSTQAVHFCDEANNLNWRSVASDSTSQPTRQIQAVSSKSIKPMNMTSPGRNESNVSIKASVTLVGILENNNSCGSEDHLNDRAVDFEKLTTNAF